MSVPVIHPEQPLYIDKRKEQILEALYDYYLMDAQQICRRVYATMGNLGNTRNHLTALRRYGYIDWTHISNHSIGGSDHAVYRLSILGIHYLQGLGYDTATRIPRKAEIPEGDGFVRHTLAVNDFLLSAEELARQNPEFTIVKMIHEQTLKRSKFKTTKRVGVNRPVPDAFLHVAYGPQEMPIWVEVDRGSEHLSNFKKKVAAIVGWHKSGAYEEEYGQKNVTVAISTTAGAHREQELKRWIAEELETLRAKEYGPVFLISYPEGQFYRDIFMGPIWSTPFSDNRESLIPTTL